MSKSVHILLMCTIGIGLFTNAKSSRQPDSWQPLHTDFKVVCYLRDQEWDPAKISSQLCSHIVYINAATLNKDTMLIKPQTISSEFKHRIALLRERGIKVLIAIGGWDDSADDKYSRLVSVSGYRTAFAQNVVDFLKKGGFDGLELQWQYPTCWQGACWKGPGTDKHMFAKLVKELRDAFYSHKLLLSAYVSPLQHEIDKAYDVPKISKYLDWISVMTHNYHGYWDRVTGHVAPMYAQLHDQDNKQNTNFSLNCWIEKGAYKKNLLMTIPTFGRSYLLSSSDRNGLGVSSIGAGEGGGDVAYSTICQNVNNNRWNVVHDKDHRVGPYAYSERQWVSFDDVSMMQYKSEYIKNMGLGGAAIWSLESDDIDNKCYCESYPLLKAINRILRDYPGPDPQCALKTVLLDTRGR